MNDTRDMRDAQAMGETLLGMKRRHPQTPTHELADALEDKRIPHYKEGPFMSNDPKEHHSKTRQDAPQGEPGGN